MGERKPIIVISDGTGETAGRVVRAALLHYDDSMVDLVIYPCVRVGEEMKRIVRRAGENDELVVYTITSTDARQQFLELSQEHNVVAVDLVGSLMDRVSGYLDQKPAGVPGMLHAIDEDYYRRIEAVEFMVKHDDGAEPRDLAKADLVLVGISRTTKTPLSAYLAQKGYCVANVPIVLGIDPPVELQECDQSRLYGLTIQPDALLRIRKARLQYLNMPEDSTYGERSHIKEELAYSNKIFNEHSAWPIIDVTNKAIEENASDILRMFKKRNAS